MKKPAIQKKNGFTLIELLIAISIFFIIAAVSSMATKTLTKGISEQIQQLGKKETAIVFFDQLTNEIHNLYYHIEQFPISGSKKQLEFTTLKQDTTNYLVLKTIRYQFESETIHKTEIDYLSPTNTEENTLKQVADFSLAYFIDNNWQDSCTKKDKPSAIKIQMQPNTPGMDPFTIIANVTMIPSKKNQQGVVTHL